MTIDKAKVVKGETLEVTLREIGPDKKAYTSSQSHPSQVHPDLLAAFKTLRLHFALLSGYIQFKGIKEKDFNNEELVEDYTVIGVSLKEGDNPGFVLTGQKKLANGKAVTLNTPFTRFEESEETGYKFINDLQGKLDRVVEEVKEYLGGKFADDPQGRLFDENATSGTTNTNTEDLEAVEEGDPNHGDPDLWAGGIRPQ